MCNFNSLSYNLHIYFVLQLYRSLALIYKSMIAMGNLNSVSKIVALRLSETCTMFLTFLSNFSEIITCLRCASFLFLRASSLFLLAISCSSTIQEGNPFFFCNEEKKPGYNLY
ncbi:hypothetical protein MANES_01G219950v8 [Manihot esculenta]|uniref:Uncharacterized protein n=1 Tax=Manihot esculenta TaxID=3983 RepID=A0ACB7IH35_MANES|nr:hypothetical protein MANES_01G219950v8 [Manihot esculenta]